MKILLILGFMVLILSAHDVINGTVDILEFDAAQTKSLQKEGVTVPLLAHPSTLHKRIALIAIPYRQTKPITLVRFSPQGKEMIQLEITQGDYKKEVLSVEPSKVSPPKAALAQIKKESEEAKAIYQTSTPKRYWKKPFEMPMQSFITSAYGTARLFNDSLQSYHSGTDYRAIIGTPVHATNDGVVVLAKERYYAGGSLVIDHGEGVYSVYYHLSALPLHVGDRVQQGEVIGLSGATGRITGPHLHFGFMVGGIPVNPLDFIQKVNALF